ncbi:MAG: GNAT family N-acetyltransferase [Chitinophagaceae bacterium]
MEIYKDQFCISTDKDKIDIACVHQFLSHSYWAENIPIATVKKSIEHSMCFGVYENVKQIGFARVVTDQSTFAHLADVFIDDNYRGRGLSKWLMEVIMKHPELQGLRNFQLGTKDAHGLYAQFGFKLWEDAGRMMRIHIPDIYKKTI